MIKLIALSTFFLLSGCAINKGTINTFYEPSYKEGSVKTLAVPHIRNARLAPSESQQIGRQVNKAIVTKNPDIKLISANKFANLINTLGMVDDYSDFIEDYITSGIANREFLEKLKENNIDAIMLSELSNAYQQDGALGIHKAKTRITLSFSIMDTSTNDIIWSATSDGIKGSATTIDEAPALIEAIDLAVKKIKQSVPKL